MASNIYPNNIDDTYPIAGQDNDTQGFRTNFLNIKNNFATAATEITALQGNINYGNTNVGAYLTTYSGNITAGNITTSNITINQATLTSAILFANLTTAQVANIAPLKPGMTVYNYTTGNIQVYNGTKWANVTLS